MKKYIAILFITVLLLIAGIFAIQNMHGWLNKVNVNELSGDIVMVNPNQPKYTADIKNNAWCIYNLVEKKYTFLGDTMLEYPVFSKDKTRVLFKKSDAGNDYSLVECDYLHNTYIQLYQGKEGNKTYFGYPYYVPGQEGLISFTENDQLYTYNTKTKEKLFVTDAGKYSWSMKGNKIVYVKDKKIYIYKVATGLTECLEKAVPENSSFVAPKFSNNGDIVGYIAHQENKSQEKIVLINLSANSTLEYDSGGIYGFCFSPDDKYVAVNHSKPSLVGMAFDLSVWDYINGRETVLIENTLMSDIDWK
jgi:dipeptidyl aminopeptidase/acylaminoacyl peptidase